MQIDLKAYPILYVDDDRTNRVVLKHNLSNEFTLLLASSGEEALAMLGREHVCVLISDQRMPGMTGVELTERVRALYPDIIRVIITAYSDLESTIDAINRGRVSRFIKKPWTREEMSAVMAECVTTFHNNTLLRDLQGKLIELERISTIGVMASSIAHDLRQPMTYIEPAFRHMRRYIDQLAEGASGASADLVEKLRETIEDAVDGVESLQLLSRSLLDTLRSNPVSMDTVQLNQVIKGVLGITRTAVSRNARMKVDLPDEAVSLRGSASHLSQLLVNLLINAVQAMEQGDILKNSISLRLLPEAERVVIEVSDTGKGIAQDELEKIFTPFFSTKGEKGSGLGLSICMNVAREHGGTIEVESQVGQGTCFRVILPRSST